MERYIDLDAPDDVVGIVALRKIHAEGPKRHQMGVLLDKEDRVGSFDLRSQISVDGKTVGSITAHAWSPRLARNIGIALIDRSVQPGMVVSISLPDGEKTTGEITDLPFL